MKKILSMFLVLSLFATALLAGCSNKTTKEKTDDGRVILNAIWVGSPDTKDNSKIEWLQKAEKRAGVKVKWDKITSDWGQKKGPLLAGGELPDLLIGRNIVTDQEMIKFKGLFQDLTPLIEKYGSNVQKMFDEDPITKKISEARDGKIYGLSKDQRFWPGSGTRQYINQKWLDNLGLDMPTTWDELFQVLKAFKKKDANGNGDPNDEIPMDFTPVGTGGFGYFSPAILLGSLGITISGGGGAGYFVEDGKVKNFLIDERYAKVVKFLHKTWEAGLLNHEVFSQDYAKSQALARGEGDLAKVGFGWGWESGDRFGAKLSSQYTSMPPLKVSPDSNIQRTWGYSHVKMNNMDNMVVMSASSEHKEAAMKFINEIYDPETSLQVMFGSLGSAIKKNDDGSYTVLPPGDPSMDASSWKWSQTWADNGPMYIPDSLKVDLPADLKRIQKESEPLRPFLDKVEKIDVYPSFPPYSVDDQKTINNNNVIILDVAMPKFSDWISKGGIDSDWNAYVTNLKNNGLDENLKIMQKYYDDYVSDLK